VTVVAALVGDVSTAFALPLRFSDVSIRVHTNDADVWASLRQYFGPWVTPSDAVPSAVVSLIQGEPPIADRFVDVVRGEGKPVKEAVRQEARGRLILKRRTGVLMGLAPGCAVAVGDLRANLNQAINLINACYAKVVTDRGYLLLHASAVARGDHVVALAGVPGAG
jgi:HprK-related kinase B